MKRFFLAVMVCTAHHFCIAQNELNTAATNKDHLSEVSPKNKALVDWVGRKIDSVRQKNKIPAISVGIIKDGKILFSGGFGLHNLKGTRKASEISIYQIASDTKKMTGIIANNLANEEKLKLDEPIIGYLGNSIEKEAQKRLGGITLRQLLTHKSGLPYRQPTMKRKDGEPLLIPYTEQDLLTDLNNVALKSEPGTKFGYSNFGYAVAGYICEKASGEKYGELVDRYISKAYQMPNTTISLTEEQSKNLATPYRKENRTMETKPFIMGKLAAAGGVYSTISDLTNLMLHQIDAYANYTLQRKSNPLILHEKPYEREDGYGFGLGKKVFENGIQFGHGGDLDGFASAYLFSPEYKSGVILLTSSGGKWVGQMEKEIFHKLTGRK